MKYITHRMKSIKEGRMMKQTFSKRFMSLVLCLAMLLSYLPLSAMAAEDAITDNRVADPSTMDGWKAFFPIEGELSTENAGGVWMDKSVFTDASVFAPQGISKGKENSFLVALSAIGSNMTVTGMSMMPTDTMLVLDISGSMNDDSGNNDVAEDLVEAANETIAALLSTNAYNRVGVVLYSGPLSEGGAASSGDAVVMLPLGRYITDSDGAYLNYKVTGNYSTTESVSLDADLVYEGTQRAPESTSKNVAGATYIQKGMILAMNQFLADGNAVTVETPQGNILQRKPVMVLMSDGSPTVGSTNFADPGSINLGSGTSTSAALGFVSQLSAAYAKAKIEEKYGTDSLMYTLGLGVDNDAIALSVLDPDHSRASTAVKDFWIAYAEAEVGENVVVQRGYNAQNNRTVTKLELPLEENYVDTYFSANGASGNLAEELKQAFADIVGSIQLQSGYYPTLIAENEDLSGYVSFVDRIGEYMEVVDIKGILIGGVLFAGDKLASNFVPGGGALGTYEQPTELGHEMVAAVRERLGLENDDAARTLIGLAYEYGQIRYDVRTGEFSNYIGWYANAAGEFLGFYHQGVTVLPESSGNVDTDPVYIMRSYGYLGAVDKAHGVSESDMMYATVQLRESIATGEQVMIFAVPAALLPVVSYHVTLREDGVLTDLAVSGAQEPIRLLYEVALWEEINPYTVSELVSAEYLAENTNQDGSVNFYTNQWDHANITGYGTINSYGYFNPSRQNNQYYYLEDTLVYSDLRGTLYTGAAQPAGEMYRAYMVYKKGVELTSETVYIPISDESMATAVRNADGSWHIPAGNVFVSLDGYDVEKSENLTQTLPQSSIAFVDTTNHSINEAGYHFYVGATFGNNGRLALKPETGIKLSKLLAEGAEDTQEAFAFTLTNLSDSNHQRSYDAWLIRADGTEVPMTVSFAAGKATVELKAEEVLYIGGMENGQEIRVEEAETVKYIPSASGLSAAGTVIVEANTMAEVTFINATRGSGNLTVAKEVEHDFGVEYAIPADKMFTIQVTLQGVGTANATFAAQKSGSQLSEVTTDGNGRFTVTLGHDEHITLFALPAGTTASVVEQAPASGFTPIYWDNGVRGDGVVKVEENSTASVIVINDYQPAEVYPVEISVVGEKLLENQQWQPGYSFTFRLEKLLSDGSWQQLGEVEEAKYGKTTFSFNEAFANESYAQAGVYYYRVVEIEPETPLGGFQYDKTVHSFSVVVGDTDMDGKLEIVNVAASRPETTGVERTENGWTVSARFTNVYAVSGSASVTIDLNKQVEDLGGGMQSLAGFTFGLYDGEELVYTSPATTDRGFARFVLSYSQEGVYSYLLKEIRPATVPAGWTYSDAQFPVTVVVSDNGDGTLGAVIFLGNTRPENAGTSIETTFVNRYDPADAVLNIDFVSKILEGRELVAGEFTFEIQPLDGSAAIAGSNDQNGKVIFAEALHFDRVGVYYYNVVETSRDGNGVTTDQSIYRISVTVSDLGGRLSASYVVVNGTGDQIVFHNIYQAKETSYTIRGTKVLTGRTLLNDEFRFVLTEALNANGDLAENAKQYEAHNQMDGSFAFPAISYTEAGTYYYVVSEISDSGSAYGIQFDQTRYVVIVTVTDDTARGELVATANLQAEQITFVNRYVPNPVAGELSGEKVLYGQSLTEGRFFFEIWQSDANWEFAGEEPLQTVGNLADGTLMFDLLDYTQQNATAYTQAGSYYYLVREVNGGEIIDGVTYDDTVYRVRVEVTDDLKGQLHITVHIYDDGGVPQQEILFTNHYTAPEVPDVPQTGDRFHLWLALLLVSSGAVLCTALFYGKKQRDEA